MPSLGFHELAAGNHGLRELSLIRIDATNNGRITRLYVHGDVDVNDADRIRLAGCDALNPYCSTLRIDLSGVTFIGAGGIAALVAIRNDALARHILVLENISPAVDRILRISGLDSVFNIQ
jgi:anti-anti-sigma factor